MRRFSHSRTDRNYTITEEDFRKILGLKDEEMINNVKTGDNCSEKNVTITTTINRKLEGDVTMDYVPETLKKHKMIDD